MYRGVLGSVLQHYQQSPTPSGMSHGGGDTDVGVLSDNFRSLNMVPYQHVPHPIKKEEGKFNISPLNSLPIRNLWVFHEE